MMTGNDEISSSIAYCGLICRLCFRAKDCDGCRTASNRCDRNCSDAGCYQKNCCAERLYEGCWECPDLNGCENGIYSLGNYSKIKAFAICIKENGREYFIDRIVGNAEKGLNVEKGGDYDGKTIEAVLHMIRGE